MRYYILEQRFTRDTPFMDIDYGGMILSRQTPAPADCVCPFTVKGNLQADPNICDYHVIGGPAFSSELRKIVDTYNLIGVEWVQAVGKVHDVEYIYWILHSLLRVDCIDRDLSEIRWAGERIRKILKLVLNIGAITDVRMNSAPIFYLDRKPIWIVGEPLALAMMDSPCTGFSLVPVEEWSSYVGRDL